MVAVSTTPATAIKNYAELVTAIKDWLDRDDIADDRIGTFINLAEDRFNRLLRYPDMETSATIYVTGESAVLPTDFMELRAVYREGNPDDPLQSMSPHGLRTQFMGMSGQPLAYAIEGRQMIVGPVGNARLEIVYYARVPALTDTTPTNWLLDRFPAAYLYGALTQAEAFLVNPERAAFWQGALNEALGEIIEDGKRGRWGAGPLRPTGVTSIRGARC